MVVPSPHLPPVLYPFFLLPSSFPLLSFSSLSFSTSPSLSSPYFPLLTPLFISILSPLSRALFPLPSFPLVFPFYSLLSPPSLPPIFSLLSPPSPFPWPWDGRAASRLRNLCGLLTPLILNAITQSQPQGLWYTVQPPSVSFCSPGRNKSQTVDRSLFILIFFVCFR